MTARRNPEAGYNLVLLAVLITLMSIAAAAAMPLWSTAIQREREEELIFRGWQYAEGIRVFQQRFGRLPVRLAELVEVEPRCVRQLWKDPITGSDDWGLVMATGQGGGAAVGGRPGRPVDGSTGRPGRPGQPGQPGQPETGPDGRPVGPILGVYSRSGAESIKTLFGQQRYDQWQFTVQALSERRRVPGQPQGVGAPGQNRQPTPARWIGRPLPGQTPPDSGLPASDLQPSPPGGAGGRSRG